MQTTIYTILGAAAITALWINSLPTIELRSLLGFRKKNRNWFLVYMTEMLNCAMCSGFWIGLATAIAKGFTGLDVFLIAALTSVVAELLDRKINSAIALHKWN